MSNEQLHKVIHQLNKNQLPHQSDPSDQCTSNSTPETALSNIPSPANSPIFNYTAHFGGRRKRFRAWTFTLNVAQAVCLQKYPDQVFELNESYSRKLPPKHIMDLFDEKSISYFVVGFETAPTTNMRHYQGYCYFKNAVSFDSFKKSTYWFIHCEPAKADAKTNREYCIKSGKYVEFGDLPQQGRRTDIEKFLSSVNANPINYETGPGLLDPTLTKHYLGGSAQIRNARASRCIGQYRKKCVIRLHKDLFNVLEECFAHSNIWAFNEKHLGYTGQYVLLSTEPNFQLPSSYYSAITRYYDSKYGFITNNWGVVITFITPGLIKNNPIFWHCSAPHGFPACQLCATLCSLAELVYNNGNIQETQSDDIQEKILSKKKNLQKILDEQQETGNDIPGFKKIKDNLAR